MYRGKRIVFMGANLWYAVDLPLPLALLPPSWGLTSGTPWLGLGLGLAWGLTSGTPCTYPYP